MKVKVTAKVLNVRKKASAESPVLSTLKEGDLVIVAETVSGWHRIDRGWINAAFTEPVPVAPPAVPASKLYRRIDLNNHGLKPSTREIIWMVVHCTAGWPDESTEDLIKGFRDRGWKNNGYHLVINADGTVDLITELNGISNGVEGNNSKSIHVSYKGGIKKLNGKVVPADTRTDAQKKSLVQVLSILKKLHPKAGIRGHRDFSPDKNGNGKVDYWERIKECPCFDSIPEYQAIK